MGSGYLVDVGACVDLPAARRAGALVAVEALWEVVPDGRDRFDVEGFLAMRERVAQELSGRRTGSTTLAAVTRLLEDVGVVDEAVALAVDAVYRDVRDRSACPLPGVVEVLSDLRARHRVALVAIGTMAWRALGVEVDTVVVPGPSGLDRADPDLVRHVAASLRTGVGDLVVVAPFGSPLLAAAAGAGAVACPVGPGGLAEVGGALPVGGCPNLAT